MSYESEEKFEIALVSDFLRGRLSYKICSDYTVLFSSMTL